VNSRQLGKKAREGENFGKKRKNIPLERSNYIDIKDKNLKPKPLVHGEKVHSNTGTCRRAMSTGRKEPRHLLKGVVDVA